LRSQFLYLIPFLLAAFICCNGPFGRKKERQTQPVEFTIAEHSPLFNEELLKVEIDTLNNMLHICLVFDRKALKKFPFPKYKNADTLTETAFNFNICHNGKLLEGADLTDKRSDHSYFGYNKWLSKTISFQSDSLDLKNTYTIPFTIPMYAFQKLHAGPNDLELKISQSHFFSDKFSKLYVDSLDDSTYHDVRNFIKAPLISATLKFRLNIPKIFKTTLYGHSIELRNDSVYSPLGMDNTIWNSSLPDVYWTVDFPDQEFYCSSDYQKSTYMYDAKDTFYLYHYTPYDSIMIGVWDHDNLSRDDYISYERFSLGKFRSNEISSFSFDNIKEFKLKVVRQGYINK
jgi:hypothetical protein